MGDGVDATHRSAEPDRPCLALRVGPPAARGLIPAQRKLALAMFEKQDMTFRWACGTVMKWTGAPRLPGTVTIHGTADRLFPIRRQSQVDVTIQDGGHLMIMDRAAEVTNVLLRILQ